MQARLDRGARGTPRLAQRHRRPLRQLGRERGGLVREPLVGHDAIHDPETQAVGGSDHAAEVYQLASTRQADAPRQALGSAEPGNEPERDLRQPEAGALGGERQIARQHELETAAERRTVHRGHDGDVEVVDAAEDVVPEPRVRVPLGGAHGRHGGDIGPSAERPARACDDDRAHRVVLRDPVERARQGVQGGGIEGIERLWPVEAQRRDAVAALDENGLDVAVRHFARGHNVFEPGLPLRAWRRPDRCGASAKNAWRPNGGRAIACRRTSRPTTIACRLRACPDGSPEPSSP